MRLKTPNVTLARLRGVTGSFWDHARIILKSAVPCNGRFTRFLSYLGASLFRVSVIFGEVAVRLFASGTVLGEIWNDCWSTKCSMFMFNTKCIPKARKMTRRWRSDGLISGSRSDQSVSHFGNRKDVSATSFLARAVTGGMKCPFRRVGMMSEWYFSFLTRALLFHKVATLF